MLHRQTANDKLSLSPLIEIFLPSADNGSIGSTLQKIGNCRLWPCLLWLSMCRWFRTSHGSKSIHGFTQSLRYNKSGITKLRQSFSNTWDGRAMIKKNCNWSSHCTHQQTSKTEIRIKHKSQFIPRCLPIPYEQTPEGYEKSTSLSRLLKSSRSSLFVSSLLIGPLVRYTVILAKLA